MSLLGAILGPNYTFLKQHETLNSAGHAEQTINTRGFQPGGTQMKLMLKLHYQQY